MHRLTSLPIDTIPRSSARTISAVSGRRRRVRRLVVFKDTCDPAKKSFFLLCAVGGGVAGRVRVRSRRRNLVASQPKHAGKESLDSRALVAGVGRLGTYDECRGIAVGAGRCRQQIGGFVEL